MRSKLEVNTKLAELHRELAIREALAADTSKTLSVHRMWARMTGITYAKIRQIEWVLNAR